MHLDIWVADIEAEATRLEKLGAKRMRVEPFTEATRCHMTGPLEPVRTANAHRAWPGTFFSAPDRRTLTCG